VYDVEGSPDYNSNQMSYLRNNSNSNLPVNNGTSNIKKYKSPSGLSNIEEKDLEYSQMMQPTQTSVHNSAHGKVNPFSPSPKNSNYNSQSPDKSNVSRSRSPQVSHISRNTTISNVVNKSPK
jgi:hypothetical protein